MADQADRPDRIGVDDALLTAWLDGQLPADERAVLDRRLAADANLRARLDVLRAGEREFEAAYAALLAAAPAERLKAMLDGLSRRHTGRDASSSVSRGWMAVAAALVIFAAGALAGYLVPVLTAGPPEPPGWRQVVAEYYTLVTPETLAVIADNPEAMAAELDLIGSRLELTLTPDRLALPDAALKRAQLYDFRGRPLVQLAYLSEANGPISLCIIANGRPDADPAFEEREGSNVVFWTRDGRGYMLIGKAASRETLEAYAGEVAAQFG